MQHNPLSKVFVVCSLIMVMMLFSSSPAPVDAQEPAAGSEAAESAVPFPLPQGTAFTYQGHLANADGPVTASCDMTFQLFHALINPPIIVTPQYQPLSEPQTKEDIAVVQGVFSVILDFGGSFGRTARWMNITVDCGSGAVELGLQPVYTVPVAIYAQNIPSHNHLGVTWDGSEALTIQGNVGDPALAPLVLSNSHANGDGLRVLAAGRNGLQVVSAGKAGLDIVGAGTTGVFIASAGNSGVYVAEAGGHGVYATTTSAADYGGQFNNNANGGVGLYARGGDGNTPDLVLAGNNEQEAGDNGRIASDPQFPSSDIFLTSNDAVVVTLDSDGQGDDASDFEVRDTNGATLFRVNEGGTTSVKVLAITGGDLAEPFEIVGAGAIEPGMVVAIDPDHPGQMRLATVAYDRTVAGVISGAGGIEAGVLMYKEGATPGSHPVALSGRVYVYADASHAPIAPGDLLTTSAIPGHAMKVTDHARAQGAILGKAMSRLEAGTGLVLVLVTLQ
jgi:hypothetical protein